VLKMSEVLEDEITSINAIYDSDTLSRATDDTELVLKVPSAQVSLRLAFPSGYPEDCPVILGPHSIGEDTRKGEAHEFVQTAKSLLNATFVSGEPCVFGLLEELIRYLEEEKDAASNMPSVTEDDTEGQEDSFHSSVNEQVQAVLALNPDWTLSVPITEKKSIFVARAARVTSPTLAADFLKHLLLTDKKAAKATHNITAWRVRDGEVTYQDCDDDGETAAGGRLLHLMQIMNVWDVMVVVTRWYGGVHLGSDRFRIINQVARDALVQGGWVKEDGEKKKGHK